MLVDVDHRIAGRRERSDQPWIPRHRFFEHDGAHPRVIHVAELGAERASNVNEIAFVAQCGAAAIDRCAEIVLTQLDIMGKTAAAEHDRLAGQKAFFAFSAVGLDADDFTVGISDDALNTVAGANINPVPFRRLRHRAYRDFAAIRHALACVFGKQHASFRCFVFRKLRPIIRNEITVPIFERAFVAQ